MIARARGTIVRASEGLLIGSLCGARLGDGVIVESARGPVAGRVLEVGRSRIAVGASALSDGVRSGDAVVAGAVHEADLGAALFGRAIDAGGRPLDGGLTPRGARYPVPAAAVAQRARRRVEAPLWTGVAAIDALLTLGRGARVGLFGPPGCGKSTLLEAIAANVAADAVVVALVGERGREAERWIARRDARTTIVCAAADRPAAERLAAAERAMAQAAALRSRGLHVLLALDSLARFASAARDRRTARGEMQGRGGYPPRVWDDCAALLEVAGPAAEGSITLLATVLCEAEDERDPLAFAARSMLDGHLVLSPSLARAGRFPAIDVPASASRTMPLVASRAHLAAAARVRRALAALAETEELRAAGLTPGDETTLAALAAREALERLLRATGCSPAETVASLCELARALYEGTGAPEGAA